MSCVNTKSDEPLDSIHADLTAIRKPLEKNLGFHTILVEKYIEWPPFVEKLQKLWNEYRKNTNIYIFSTAICE